MVETAVFYSILYSLGSLFLGVMAWIFACAAIKCGKLFRSYQLSAGSFAMCISALLLQLLEVKNRAGIRDFASIEDTIRAVVTAAFVLIGITFMLNAAAVVKAGRARA